MSHFPFYAADFCGEGKSHLRWSGRFGANTKLLRGVIGPISTSNDYLNTIFVKLVSL